MKKLLVFVVGPTAIGKTSTAIDLAIHFDMYSEINEPPMPKTRENNIKES